MHLVGHVKDVHTLRGNHTNAFPMSVDDASHTSVVNILGRGSGAGGGHHGQSGVPSRASYLEMR